MQKSIVSWNRRHFSLNLPALLTIPVYSVILFCFVLRLLCSYLLTPWVLVSQDCHTKYQKSCGLKKREVYSHMVLKTTGLELGVCRALLPLHVHLLPLPGFGMATILGVPCSCVTPKICLFLHGIPSFVLVSLCPNPPLLKGKPVIGLGSILMQHDNHINLIQPLFTHKITLINTGSLGFEPILGERQPNPQCPGIF